MTPPIQVGTRVYLAIAVAGEPGCVVAFDRTGKAIVHWPDLGLDHNTHHSLDSLVVDEAFTVKQYALDFEEMAA